MAEHPGRGEGAAPSRQPGRAHGRPPAAEETGWRAVGGAGAPAAIEGFVFLGRAGPTLFFSACGRGARRGGAAPLDAVARAIYAALVREARIAPGGALVIYRLQADAREPVLHAAYAWRRPSGARAEAPAPRPGGLDRVYRRLLALDRSQRRDGFGAIVESAEGRPVRVRLERFALDAELRKCLFPGPAKTARAR